MKLIKAQTNGNDFIIMQLTNLSTDRINQICDRHCGIGCDQLIMYKQSSNNTFDLLFYNNDGSLANMCGNGSCAFALFANKYIDKNLSKLYINVNNIKYEITTSNNKINITFPMPYYIDNNKTICTGNYHRIYNIESINKVKEIQKKYPECNIHFIQEQNNIENIDNAQEIQRKYPKCTRIQSSMVKVITHERGTGRTLACGSGAVAICFYLKQNIKIIHEGGISQVIFNEKNIKLITEPRIIAEVSLI